MHAYWRSHWNKNDHTDDSNLVSNVLSCCTLDKLDESKNLCYHGLYYFSDWGRESHGQKIEKSGHLHDHHLSFLALQNFPFHVSFLNERNVPSSHASKFGWF